MLKVIKVKTLPQGRLWVEMNDGRSGEFDVTSYMNAEFFAKLKDSAYFAQVRPFFAGIGWPEGQDLGPDTIAAGLVVSSSLAHD